MVSLETLQLGESRDKEPWKVQEQKNPHCNYLDLEITWKDQKFLSIFRTKSGAEKEGSQVYRAWRACCW